MGLPPLEPLASVVTRVVSHLSFNLSHQSPTEQGKAVSKLLSSQVRGALVSPSSPLPHFHGQTALRVQLLAHSTQGQLIGKGMETGTTTAGRQEHLPSER